MHPYIRDLIELDLPDGDWALFGSGPLYLRGWIDEIGDVDVLSRGAAWQRAEALGVPQVLEEDGNIISVIGEGVTVGSTWPYGDIDLMIDTAEKIEGIPCVRLEHIVAYMEQFDRPKDRVRLAVIEAHR